MRFSMDISGLLPAARAMAMVSAIIVATSSRESSCAQISAVVALVRALSGLKATLPMSLIQMSSRRFGSTGHFRPPAIMASLSVVQRAETPPVGSPMEKRVPSRWRMTPGASISVEQ